MIHLINPSKCYTVNQLVKQSIPHSTNEAIGQSITHTEKTPDDPPAYSVNVTFIDHNNFTSLKIQLYDMSYILLSIFVIDTLYVSVP